MTQNSLSCCDSSNSSSGNIDDKGFCCSFCSCYEKLWDYRGVPEAKGYALCAIGRGVAVMGNIVLNAALRKFSNINSENALLTSFFLTVRFVW